MTSGVASPRPTPPAPDREVRVVSMTWEAEGVLSVVLADPAGRALPPWSPGAHIDVDLVPGLRRSYSLCGDPCDDRTLTVAVLHEPAGSGASAYVHAALRPGALLRVSHPRNNFALVDAAEYLFIAGGIGITPLLPMISAVHGRGTRWRLLYGGRRRASMAFLDRIERYGEHVLVRPEDEFGLLDLDRALDDTTPGTAVFCCGPEPLLAAAETACAKHHRTLLLERFAARQRPGDAPATTFEVVCRRSGAHASVGPDQSILDVLREAGLPVAYSCQDGICGTCETAVVEGDIEHRDSVLSDAERRAGDTMLICVSRCRSPRLVLDV